MNTLVIGIASREKYKKRTMAIARGEYVPKKDEPKVWFESIQSMAQVLSDQNRELLNLILVTKPDSLTELARQSGRHASNLSRTLKTMEQYGLVELQEGPNRQVIPKVNYSGIRLEMAF
jgi:predicted transcriptional regulator